MIVEPVSLQAISTLEEREQRRSPVNGIKPVACGGFMFRTNMCRLGDHLSQLDVDHVADAHGASAACLAVPIAFLSAANPVTGLECMLCSVQSHCLGLLCPRSYRLRDLPRQG